MNDMTFGLWSALAVPGGTMDFIPSDAYQQGRELGRSASTAQAQWEMANGIGMAVAGAAAGPPTLAATAVCAAGTAGICALPGGVVLTAEGAMVLGGAAEAALGVGQLAYIKTHPISDRSSAGSSDKQPSNPLQTGGHVINNSTAKSLGLSRQEANDAMHALKEERGLSNDFHGKMMSNGNFVDPHSGEVLGNIFDYVH